MNLSRATLIALTLLVAVTLAKGPRPNNFKAVSKEPPQGNTHYYTYDYYYTYYTYTPTYYTYTYYTYYYTPTYYTYYTDYYYYYNAAGEEWDSKDDWEFNSKDDWEWNSKDDWEWDWDYSDDYSWNYGDYEYTY